MGKQKLIAAAAAKSGITQWEVRQAIEPFFECILETLEKGEPVTIHGFGSFLIKQRNERNSRNPYNGEPIVVPAKKVVKFKITPKFSFK
jgi:DNA-binding protein HU-beta